MNTMSISIPSIISYIFRFCPAFCFIPEEPSKTISNFYITQCLGYVLRNTLNHGTSQIRTSFTEPRGTCQDVRIVRLSRKEILNPFSFLFKIIHFSFSTLNSHRVPYSSRKPVVYKPSASIQASLSLKICKIIYLDQCLLSFLYYKFLHIADLFLCG